MSLPLSHATEASAADSPSAVAKRSGSSFYWPMRLLPKPRRNAMFAIYAFCRCIDDIADEPGAVADKRAALAAWRRDIQDLYSGGIATSPITRALQEAIERYGLPRAELDALIDGMAMDVGTGLRGPDLGTLRRYCRRVAGAVGLLAIRVFDRADPDTEAFAVALGEALQLTNILRDLTEDAALGRLYLPHEALELAGIDSRDPDTVLAHPNLARACEAVADLAEADFADARDAIAGKMGGSLWAAVAMMVLYHRVLRRLRARGWRDVAQRVRVGRRESAWVALRCLLGAPPAT